MVNLEKKSFSGIWNRMSCILETKHFPVHVYGNDFILKSLITYRIGFYVIWKVLDQWLLTVLTIWIFNKFESEFAFIYAVGGYAYKINNIQRLFSGNMLMVLSIDFSKQKYVWNISSYHVIAQEIKLFIWFLWPLYINFLQFIFILSVTKFTGTLWH